MNRNRKEADQHLKKAKKQIDWASGASKFTDIQRAIDTAWKELFYARTKLQGQWVESVPRVAVQQALGLRTKKCETKSAMYDKRKR